MNRIAAKKNQMSARDRILEAATMLFWREGYHAVSTDAICRAAGVRKGSLYYAFAAKADIRAIALEAAWARSWSEIQAIYERPGNAEDRFAAHLEWLAESQRRLRDEHGLVLGTFDMALGVSLPEDVQSAIRANRAQHFARFKSSIAEVLALKPADDAHATWLAETVVQLILGTMIRARLENDLAPLERLPLTIFKLIRAVPRSPATRDANSHSSMAKSGRRGVRRTASAAARRGIQVHPQGK